MLVLIFEDTTPDSPSISSQFIDKSTVKIIDLYIILLKALFTFINVHSLIHDLYICVCARVCVIPVLGCWNGETSHRAAIVSLSHQQPSYRVCTAEINQVSCST